MASKTTVELIDDKDGKVAAESVSFGLDGVQYEIDLSDKNAKALRRAYEEWISVARRVGRTSTHGRSARNVATGVDNAAVRAWAESNGYEIAPRGRIKSEIVEAYRTAGN